MIKLKLKLLIIIIVGIIGMIAFIYRTHFFQLYYLSFFEANTYSNSKYSRILNYRLYRPKNVSHEKIPLIVYLHPLGRNGKDNKKQISSSIGNWARRNVQSKYKCFIFAPQCPVENEWAIKGSMNVPYKHYNIDDYKEEEEESMILEVINKLIKEYPIDINRVYLLGHSMGATGAWDIMCRHPEVFAAAIISAGVSDTTKAYKLINIPVWAFSGENDAIAPAELNKKMVEEINKNGGDAKVTILKGKGHGTEQIAFKYPGVKNWLFSISKNTDK